jgi:hypothetical protein
MPFMHTGCKTINHFLKGWTEVTNASVSWVIHQLHNPNDGDRPAVVRPPAKPME